MDTFIYLFCRGRYEKRAPHEKRNMLRTKFGYESVRNINLTPHSAQCRVPVSTSKPDVGDHEWVRACCLAHGSSYNHEVTITAVSLQSSCAVRRRKQNTLKMCVHISDPGFCSMVSGCISSWTHVGATERVQRISQSGRKFFASTIMLPQEVLGNVGLAQGIHAVTGLPVPLTC